MTNSHHRVSSCFEELDLYVLDETIVIQLTALRLVGEVSFI